VLIAIFGRAFRVEDAGNTFLQNLISIFIKIQISVLWVGEKGVLGI
jgi:flagellar biosynthesis protein FliQ